jgi:hypothetical protein
MKVLLLLICMQLAGCAGKSFERDFFSGPIPDRNNRLSKYDLDSQWKLYLYGNQKIHPPTTELAEAFKNGGEPVFKFVIEKLDKTENELDYRDALGIFDAMQRSGSYRICEDKENLFKVINYKNKFKDQDWKNIYLKMLLQLCHP